MSNENLEELSLNELLSLLAETQGQLTLRKLNNENAHLIEHSQNQLEKVKKAIVVKRAENPPLK
jgi:hypothetical protein